METLIDLPQRASGYIAEILRVADQKRNDIVSVIVFGSVLQGPFSALSDVDLIVVLTDGVPKRFRKQMDDELAVLELSHGLRASPKSKLEIFYTMIDKRAGLFLSHFVCYKNDLLSGNPAKVFHINPVAESFLLSARIGFGNIVLSAKTVWGEDLLDRVRIPPITRWHLLMNCLALLLFNAFALLTLPFLPNATKYSMLALKWSLHNCYFCINQRVATIEQEVDFFNKNLSEPWVLTKLLSLRRHYRRSLRFVRKSFRAILQMFMLAARHNQFPIAVVRKEERLND